MTDNNKTLVSAGHELASELKADCGAVDVRSVANLLTELASALDVQSARSEALAAKLNDVCAENAALREYRPQPSGAAMMEALDAFYEYHEDVPEQGMMAAFEILCCKRPEIPNTDAWVNEQRAVVWITGNEPEEFGRYWVRYETDVGPQYCSAKWMEHNFCAGSDTNIHKIWLADHSRSINQLRGVTHYTKLPPDLEAAPLRGSQV